MSNGPTMSVAEICVGSMSGEIWFRANIVPTSTQHFYCSHLVEFLFCSFNRVTRQNSCVGMRIMKDKSFESLQNEAGLFTSPRAVWMSAKCRNRLTCSSDNTKKWPTFGPTNVWWMLGEMSGPFDRGLSFVNEWEVLRSVVVDNWCFVWQTNWSLLTCGDCRTGFGNVWPWLSFNTMYFYEQFFFNLVIYLFIYFFLQGAKEDSFYDSERSRLTKQKNYSTINNDDDWQPMRRLST